MTAIFFHIRITFHCLRWRWGDAAAETLAMAGGKGVTMGSAARGGAVEGEGEGYGAQDGTVWTRV